MNEEEWSLPQFYTELFNYCFPIDYHMQMRQSLARCHQNDKTVAEYTYELQGLFNMIGDVPEQDRVIKFWNGTQPLIQKGLWHDNLHPEISTWDEVINQAEIIEISENVAEWWDHKSGSSAFQGSTGNVHAGVRNKSSANIHDHTIWSVTFNTNQRLASQGHSQHHDWFQSKSKHQDSCQSSSSANNSRLPSQGRFNSQGKLSVPHIYKLDSHTSTPCLSDKEKEELRAAGKCFICKEMGHMLHNCPKRNTVRSNNQRPLGALTFNIELEPVHNQSDRDDPVKILESLPVGAINSTIQEQHNAVPILLYLLAEWCEHYPYWGEPKIYPHQSIGDCYAMWADAILTLEQPYPGDECYSTDFVRLELQFEVHEKPAACKYLIYDRLTEFQVFIKKSCLTNHQFDLAHWYAHWWAWALNIHGEITHSEAMDNTISLIATM